MKIHFLTAGFKSPNARAMMFPLIVFQRELADAGYHVKFFTRIDRDIYECDVLIVESKYHGWDWQDHAQSIIAEFVHMSEQVDGLIYFDNSDSTGCLQVEVLPIVDVYCKNQLLADRQEYTKKHYGQRIFTDFYYQKYGVNDSNPLYSNSVDDVSLLDKLCVAWHSGLANYSHLGPTITSGYYRVPLKQLLRFPAEVALPSTQRTLPLQCRMGFGHGRESVSYQRVLVRQLLKNKLATNKLSRKQFFDELKNCWAVLSPFGQGEITLKDFEVFLTGGLLIKPRMDHMETWPNLFEGGTTMVDFKWDLEDLLDTLDKVETDRESHLEIAIEGQGRYRKFTAGPDAPELFINQFKSIINRLPSH